MEFVHIDTKPQIFLHLECRDFDRPGDRMTYCSMTGSLGCENPKARITGLQIFSGMVEVGNIEVFPSADEVAAYTRKAALSSNIDLKKSEILICTGRISKLIVDWSDGITIWAKYKERRKECMVPVMQMYGIARPNLWLQYSERRRPVLVQGLGRSGTTLLLSCLAAHPEILVAGRPPYEVRQAHYLWHALGLMTSPARYADSMGPDQFEVENWTLGANPYVQRDFERSLDSAYASQWLDAVWPARISDFIKASIDQYYDQVEASLGRHRTVAFVEKGSISSLRNLLRNSYKNPCEIVLVRDFRDAFVSQRAFNKKRGTQSFGRKNCTSDAEWLRNFGASARQLSSAIRDGVCLVRYEDLIMTPNETLEIVYTHIGVKYNNALVKSIVSRTMNDAFGENTHRTSKDNFLSIGRWRVEMSVEEIAISKEYLGEALTAFGYEID